MAIQKEALTLGLLDKAIPIRAIRTVEYPLPITHYPLPITHYPLPATRPVFSVMDKLATENLLAHPLPHWRVSLRQMLQELSLSSVQA